MNKKMSVILLAIILPLTFLIFYAFDLIDSKDTKISSDSVSGSDKGKGGEQKEQKSPEDEISEKRAEIIKINLNDLLIEVANNFTMNLGQKIVFEQNIEEGMVTFPADTFSLESYIDQLSNENKISLKAEVITSATISVRFEGVTYNLLIEVEDFYINPERSIDIDAGVQDSQKVIAAIINKPLAEALKIIKEAGVKHRIVSEDGLSYALTMDYSPSRINLVLINNIIHDATLG
jgi:hypothetical protein